MSEELKKIKLLMVDDEEEFLISSAQALSRRGIEVQMAFDGSNALNLLQQNPYDVVVLDVKMPGLNGEEVFQRLRSMRPELPVILFTGYGTVDQAFRTGREGVFDYLSKPADMDFLSQRIKEAAASSRNAPSPPLAESTSELPPIRTLIVDDEVELLDSLQSILQRRHMEVSTASDGLKALQLLQERLIDVVVLDVKMPGLDGIETLQRIKQAHPLVEVILLTGHPTLDAAMQGMKRGATDYVIKPPDIQDLISAIRKAWENRQARIEERYQRILEEALTRQPD
ncbi:MAG: response regulator [Calditrichota bacterium]